jgi:hypothetical protein
MKVTELNKSQIVELKQKIIEERNEANGEGTSYGELADADAIVSAEEVVAAYGDTEFSPEDFSADNGEAA